MPLKLWNIFMELIKWHDSFNVGIKIVDQHHQKLFVLVNDLITQTNTDQQKESIGKVLYGLMDYANYHFKTEENFFKMHPKFKEHQICSQCFVLL